VVEAAQRVRDPARADLEPASRSTRPKVTRWRVSASLTRRGRGRRARLADERHDGVVADEVEVLVVLQDGAEGLLDHGRVELLAAQGDERLRPVDRLGHAGRLGQVEAAQAGDERGRLGGQPLGHARHPQAQDLDLALERRVRDPVKEAAALERVVQLAVRLEVRMTVGRRRASMVRSRGW
jgi:hypothetical protein